MLIVNIHERLLPCHINSAAFLIDNFAKKNSSLWPSNLWPRESFDSPLQVGAKGAHGGTQYVVDSYKPGRHVKFKFIKPKGYLGFHQFELIESGESNTLIRHRVEFKAKLIGYLLWNHLIKWVHNALIEDAFDCAEIAIQSPPKVPHKWPKRVHFFRHLLGGYRLMIDGFRVLTKSKAKDIRLNQDYLRINPLCKVIIGFKNYTTHKTRSQYISFSPVHQPQMSGILLDLSSGSVSGDMSARWQENLVNQLIEYGLLVELVSIKQRLKNFFRNPLNENRLKIILYKNKSYLVTSFVFMAFNSQLPKQYIRETVTLPYWTPSFANQVFKILKEGLSRENLALLPFKIEKKLINHGVLIPEQDYPTQDRFFHTEALLDSALLEYIPQAYQLSNLDNQDLELNKQVFFFENLPQFIVNRFYDVNGNVKMTH